MLLDLFSGQGAAGTGWDIGELGPVIGIDTDRLMLKRYPFECHLMDWQAGLERFGADADLIHASPPCQHYSCQTRNANKDNFPDLVDQVREALLATGKPFVIENVPGAPLRNHLILCGCMFGLGVTYRGIQFAVYRKRLFEVHGFKVVQPRERPHDLPALTVKGHGQPSWFLPKHGFSHVPNALVKEAMGTPWMTQEGTAQSIPPVFTQYLAAAFLCPPPLSDIQLAALAA